MADAKKSRSLLARILWVAVPLAIGGAAAAFLLWPRTDVFYSDGKQSWPAQPGMGLRQVLWDAGDLLQGLGDADQDYDPCLSGDGQELYFTRGKADGHADIYVAYRTLEGWTEPAPLAGVNSAADDIGPALARDGATLYFYSNRPGGHGGYDLYAARHGADGWSAPANLGPRINGPFNEYDPFVSPDGAALLFSSNRPTPAELEALEKTWRATLREEAWQRPYDIYAADLDTPDATPRRLDAVCSAANDGQPALSPDGVWLYFASDRAGGKGGYDLWRSRVTGPALTGLMSPENLGSPVNTAANELDPAVSLEGFGLYFSSNRARPEAYALYYARSHEVFQVVQTRRLAIGPMLGELSWPLLGLLAALLGLVLTLLALARLRRRPGLLATALMVSLILHMLALSLFTVWQISYRLMEMSKQPERFDVAVSVPGMAESELSAQLRASLSDLARLDTAKFALEKSETLAAPVPPQAPEPEVALAAPVPAPPEIKIARPPERIETINEPILSPDQPRPQMDLLPPEPVARIEPRAVRPADESLPPAPRAIEVARLAPEPVPAAAPSPPPAPQTPPRDVPPALAAVVLPDAPTQLRLPEPLPPLEARTPEAAQPAPVVDFAPPPETPLPVRAAPAPAEAAPDEARIRAVAATRAETPVTQPAAPAVAPQEAAPAAQPAAGAMLLARAVDVPAAPPSAAVVMEPVPASGPVVAASDILTDTPPPAAGPLPPRAPTATANGTQEAAPPARSLVVVRQAEGPVAMSPAPAVTAPAQAAAPRLALAAVGPLAREAPQAAAQASAVTPVIDPDSPARPGPAIPEVRELGPVDFVPVASQAAPRQILPAAPPLVIGPREHLAASRREPAAGPRALPDRPEVQALTADLARPDERTLLASAAPRAGAMGTPEIGDQALAAALPPAAPVAVDVGAPPAPLPPKEIYRLRTQPREDKTIEKLGGTPETEEAVRKALVWCARHQSKDGRWDVNGFMQNYEAGGNRADGGGNRDAQDVGVTSLAALAFIGAGHTHAPARGSDRTGPHADNVRRAIDWLLANQKPDGDLRQGGQMYDHCLATMVLCESFSMTGDERLAAPARRAVDFIVKAQNPNLGWRYEPRADNDTSVLGWALMALKSAQIAGFEVPPRAWRGAAQWLDRVRKGKAGGLYEYQPGRGPSPAMTAEGLFSQLLVEFQPDHPRTRESVAYVLKHRPRWVPQNLEDTNLYYWYYATLALHQLGGDEWDEWNRQIRETLVKAQRQDGPFEGSWDARTRWGEYGGRVYSTAIAALTLEVYYRYLPFYELKLGEAEGRE